MVAGTPGDPLGNGGEPVIRTVIDLPLLEGEADRLLQLFRELGILETCAAQPGCRSAELALAEDGSRAMATAVWDDHDAYSRWLDHPDRPGFAQATTDLLATAMSAQISGTRYRIAHVVTSEAGETGWGGGDG